MGFLTLDLSYGKAKFGKFGLSMKKLKQWIFHKILQPVTWKSVDAHNWLSLWWYVYVNMVGQGHFLTLAPKAFTYNN